MLHFEFEVDILIRATAAVNFRSFARMVLFTTTHIFRGNGNMLQIPHTIVQMQRHPCRKQGINSYQHDCKKSAHKTKIRDFGIWRKEKGERRSGEAEKGYGEAEKGYGEAEKGYGEVEKGYGEAEKGYGEAEKGYGERMGEGRNHEQSRAPREMISNANLRTPNPNPLAPNS